MGTTAQKLTYLNTTKGLIKDSINALGGNLTNESTFRSYTAALDSIYNVLPKTTGTGTTLSLTPTLPGKLVLDLKGNTSQVQLSGKNLFNDYNTTSSTDRGITYSFTNNEILINGTYDQTGNWNCWLTASNNGTASNDMALLSANTNYTISIYIVGGTTSNTNNQIYISSRDSNKSNFAWNYKLATYDSSTQRYKVSFTTTDSVYISGIRYSITSNGTAVFNNLKLKIQIEQNNTSTDYEQYCGGTPSPNPSYPQDIHNVSGNNTIYVRNKNLKSDGTIYNLYFNATTFSSGNRTLCIPIEANTTYYIKKPIISNRFRVCLSNAVPSKSTSVYEYQDVSSLTETSITNTNYAYLNIFFYQTGETYTEQELYDCLNIYTQETAYPINLPSGMELCKIGTYQDYFYKEDDKWYLHKEIGKLILNGTEADSDYGTGTTGSFTRFGYNPFMNTNLVKIQSDYVSNYFRYLGTIGGDTTEEGISNTQIANLNRLFIFLPTSLVSTISAFKTWLTTHNTIIYYQLATPTNTEITDTTLINQLEAIYNAKSKNGTTNINQENNDLPFIITASCLKGA